MAELEKQFEYKGRNVSISTTESKGRWSWSYTIDVLNYFEMRDRSVAAEGIAVLEASHDAKWQIDQMK